MQKKPYKDYSGIKVDNLTFKQRFESQKTTKWILVCGCGNELIRRPDNVFDKRGFKSCGCIKNTKGIINYSITKIYGSYSYGAKKRNLSFEITRNELSEIIIKNCHYCGTTPSLKISYNSEFFMYNGIDRKNSNLGYFLENIVPCCFVCNRGKSNMNYEDWKNHLIRISKFNNNI